MVERSLSMREASGSIPDTSNFFLLFFANSSQKTKIKENFFSSLLKKSKIFQLG
jgi:hypothetical protein